MPEQRTQAKPIKTGILCRTYELNRSALDKEKRTVVVIASTETPVKRWFGEEVLSHEPGAINLNRLKGGAAVLMEHDSDKLCGVTETASIVDRQLQVTIRFARDEDGDKAMNRVEDGIYRYVSIGYSVARFEVNDDEDEYRAIDWEPLEVSFVGIPADQNAKVLRNNGQEKETIVMKRTLLLEAQPAASGGGAPAIITSPDESHLERASEIANIMDQYRATVPEIVEAGTKAIRDKTSVREFYKVAMELSSKAAERRLEPARILATGGNMTRDNSIGGQFVRSAQYKEASKRKIGKGNHINLDLPEMYSFRTFWPDMQTRVNFGIGTSDVSGTADLGGTSGAGIDIIRQPWHPLNQQPLNIADLFSQGTTSGDVVRYIRELSYTQAAARVAEAAGKPQAQLDVGVVNATVEKTAVYLDVTEEMMNDWQQASSFINSRLSYMVQSKEEDYLLNGTGSSQITGIYNTSGIQTLSGAANTIDQFLRAKAYIEGANGSGFAMPDAYVMNPLDWLSVRLSKDGNNQYLFGGPGYAPYGVGGFSNVGSMWGLPVVTTVLNAQGTALVGAFRMGAQIFRRQGVTIRTTDSDGSKFLSNILTVLAESRFTLAVYQPNRFCSITGIPAAS